MSTNYSSPRHDRGDSHLFSNSFVETNGCSNGRMSRQHIGRQSHDNEDSGKLVSEMGSFVLVLFSVVLLGSGSTILTICFLSESPTSSVIRYAILPATHALSILFYSLILTASLMCFVSLVTILSVFCCSSPDFGQEYETVLTGTRQETEMLNRTHEEPDQELTLPSEFLQSSPRSPYHSSHSRPNGKLQSKASSKSNGVYQHNGSTMGRHGGEKGPSSDWMWSETAVTTSSQKSASSPPSYLYCFLIFMLLFLLTIQLTVSFIGFVSSSSLETLMNDDNQTSFIDALLVPTSETPAHFLHKQGNAFDKIQSALRCCGLREYTDYDSADPVPESCCRTPTPGCGKRKHPSNIFYEGCGHRIQRCIGEDMIKLSTLSLGFSSVAAIGLFLSCYFYVMLINDHNRRSRI